ncbi:hypothetical protein M0812_07860 [Anaeramoeba flamelloides]|uniref:Transposase n=1 Tax=Anaeramoeba flamelloides TaxID=1746091 RepID=A0AAV8A2A5_9EUKA|nr:hypothetical protein M0812_07860 [Anaeramoeba flamelloides]
MLPSEQIKRLKQRGRKSNLTESELQDFKNWVLNQNRKGIICGGNEYIDYLYQKYAWKPSKSSISRILKKIRISSHKTISKKPTQLQPNFHKKLENFKLELNKLVIDKTKKYPNFNIWVMDEKGIWNHHPSRRTYTSIDNPMPYVKELSNNQKDTIAATVSFKGEAKDLFWIKSKKASKTQRKVSGMNNEIMCDWADSFLKYAKRGGYIDNG